MRKPNPFPFLVFFVIVAAGVAFAYARYGTSATAESMWTLAVSAPLLSSRLPQPRLRISGTGPSSCGWVTFAR